MGIRTQGVLQKVGDGSVLVLCGSLPSVSLYSLMRLRTVACVLTIGIYDNLQALYLNTCWCYARTCIGGKQVTWTMMKYWQRVAAAAAAAAGGGGGLKKSHQQPPLLLC